MPTQDLYTGIVVTIMFLIGLVSAVVKLPRRQREHIAKQMERSFNKVRAFRANHANHRGGRAA